MTSEVFGVHIEFRRCSLYTKLIMLGVHVRGHEKKGLGMLQWCWLLLLLVFGGSGDFTCCNATGYGNMGQESQ